MNSLPNQTFPALNHNCPLCGQPNLCAPASSGNFASTCWCTTQKIDAATLEEIPANLRNIACICANCAGIKTISA